MPLIRQVARRALCALLPPRIWLARGPSGESGVALTFDDGPDPEHTPRVLDELSRKDVRGTFFVIGHKAAKHPDLVRRIVAEGHALGNHSYFHSNPTQTSTRQLASEIRLTQSLLENLSGNRVSLFRPPFGKLSFGKLCAVWKESNTVVLWDVDPRDFLAETAQSLNRWCESYQPYDGNIVLLHDDRPFTAELVSRLIDRIRSRNLGFQRVTDWLANQSLTRSATTTA